MRKHLITPIAGSRSAAARHRHRAAVPALAAALLGATAVLAAPPTAVVAASAASAAGASGQWLPIGPPAANASLSQVMVGPPAAGADSIYAIQLESAINDLDGLWHSADGGATWSGPLTVTAAEEPTLVLGGQPGELYAIGNPDLFNTVPTTGVSRDGGATWDFLALPPNALAAIPVALAADPLLLGKFVEIDCMVTDIVVNISLCGSFSIFATNTGGRGFRLLGTLPDTQNAPPLAFVRPVPGNPGQAYAVITGLLWKSTPGSLSLSLLPLRGPVEDVAIAPSSGASGGAAGTPPTLYAAIGQNRTIWKSTDGGDHWLPASAGLPRSLHNVALALDLVHPSTLYLAAREGLFATDDGAASWQALPSEGLPPLAVTSITAGLTTSSHTVYVGTDGAGAFVLTRP